MFDVLHCVREPMFVINGEHQVIFWNEAATAFYRVESDKALHKPVSEIVPSFYDLFSSDEAQKTLAINPFWRGATQCAHHFDQPLWIEWTVSRCQTDCCKSGYLVFSRDISFRKQMALDSKMAVDALRQSEEKYRGIFDGSVAAIYLFDTNKRFIDSNQAGLDLLGYTRDELLKLGLSDVDKDPVVDLPSHKQLLRGDQLINYEHQLRRKDGSIITVLNNSIPTTDAEGNVVGLLSTLVDITQRKQFENSLRESEAKLAQALSIAKLGYWELDIASGMFTFSDSFYAIFRTTAVEAGGYRMSIAEYARRFVHPDDASLVAEETRMALSANDPHFSRYIEHRMLYADGGVGHIAVRFFIVKDANGNTVKTYGVNQDITERKKALLALRESEANFRTFFETIGDFIVVASQEGRIRFANRALRKKLGYSSDDILHMTILDLRPESMQQEAAETFRDMLNGECTSCSLPFVHKDKTWIPAETRVWFGRWNNENCIFGVSKDLSMEQEAHYRFERLFRGNPNPTALNSVQDRTFTDVNDAFTKVIGYSREEVIGKTASELGLFLKPKGNGPAYETLTGKGFLTDVELQVRTKDGRVLDGLFSGEVIRIQGREYTLTVMTDITERKRTEMIVRRADRRYRAMIEKAPDGVVLVHPEHGFVYASPSALRLFGYPAEELTKHHPDQLTHPDDLPMVLAALHNLIENPDSAPPTLVYRFLNHSGNWRWVESTFTNHLGDPDVEAIIINFRDVTERQRSETLLQTRLALADTFADDDVDTIMRQTLDTAEALTTSTIGFFHFIDPDQLTVSLQVWSTNTENSMCHAAGKGQHYPVDDGGVWVDAVRAMQPVIHNDYESLPHKKGLPEGHARIVREMVVPVVQDGRITAILGVGNKSVDYDEQDVASVQSLASLAMEVIARKRAETELRQRESYLSAIIENQPGLLWLKDRESRFLSVNKAFAQSAGLSNPDELIGKTDGDIWPADLAEKYRQDDAAVMARGTSIVTEESIALDGGRRIFETFKKPVLDESGAIIGTTGYAHDITDRKSAEAEKIRLTEQLQQAMKMEAIGRLAGGVAHDFNNLLTGISGNTELALMDLKPHDPLTENLNEIRKAANSAATLTRQLLAFSRKQMIEPKVININDLITSAKRMLMRLIGEDIELQTVTDPDLGAVKVDPGQFEQIVVNLAVNARDAMPTGGRLTIETANVRLDKKDCQLLPGCPPGRYVMMAVSDTGHGIPDEVGRHIFEPFFTTKERGKGTGLGLATIYGAVRQSAGFIAFESEIDRGTTFRIYFPRVFATVEKLGREGRRANIPTGHETILVVEDEHIVRDLAVKILKRQGYTVLQADSGGNALVLAEKYTLPIHLLLTDVIMPEMDGKELAERLVVLHAETKILFVSGYSEDLIAHRGVVDAGINFIAKPYTPHSLATKVRDVLGPA